MIAGVADTHAAIWHLYGDARLSPVAGGLIVRAAAAGKQIVISPITLAEIVYLIEKNRIAADVYADVRAAIGDPEHVFKEAPFTVEVVECMRRIPRSDVADMPDRIIAATALYLGVPVISRDARIRSGGLQTVW
jgi:PIN domain nuclease of toxin-antitoxin system